MSDSQSYLIGQRVIVNDRLIATVIFRRDKSPHELWVRLPDGVERYYALSNIKPLPGGQL